MLKRPREESSRASYKCEGKRFQQGYLPFASNSYSRHGKRSASRQKRKFLLILLSLRQFTETRWMVLNKSFSSTGSLLHSTCNLLKASSHCTLKWLQVTTPCFQLTFFSPFLCSLASFLASYSPTFQQKSYQRWHSSFLLWPTFLHGQPREKKSTAKRLFSGQIQTPFYKVKSKAYPFIHKYNIVPKALY